MGREVTLGVSGVLLAGYIVVNSTYSGSYTMSDNLWTGNPYPIILSITPVLCRPSRLLPRIALPRLPPPHVSAETPHALSQSLPIT